MPHPLVPVGSIMAIPQEVSCPEGFVELGSIQKINEHRQLFTLLLSRWADMMDWDETHFIVPDIDFSGRVTVHRPGQMSSSYAVINPRYVVKG